MSLEYKYIKVGQNNLYYCETGKGEITIFLLGWLSNIDKFPIEKLISKHENSLDSNRYIFLHLSNHYKSSISKTAYSVDDYTNELKSFLQKLNIKKVNIVAHSAGGRYAINFALKYPKMVNKLVLVAAAGASNKKASKTQISRAKYYFHKFEDITEDQENILKNTFSKVFGTSYKNNLHRINNQTLIIWGTNDKTVPYKRHKTFKSKIKNSIFYPIKNKGHMIIKDQTTFSYIVNFITEDKKVTDTLIKLGKQVDIPKHIKNYQYNYLRVNPSYKARNLAILFVKKDKLKNIEKDYLNLASSLEKLCQYMLKTNDKKLKEKMSLSGVNFSKLKNKNTKSLYNYARIDSILCTKGTSILEFNARRPQMFEDVDWFNNYFNLFGIKKNKESLTKEIIHSINYQCDVNKISPKNIMLISDFEKKSGFSFYSQLKKYYSNSNIFEYNTKPARKLLDKSKLINNKLTINKNTIDLIIIQSLGIGKNSFFYNNGKIVNQNVRKAYFTNNLEISSPLTSSVIGRKQSLYLLQQKNIQEKIGLTKSEVESVNKIPKSKDLTNLSQISKDYLVKIQGVGSGKGVYYYDQINSKVKNEISNMLVGHASKVLLQKKVELTPVKIYSLKTLKPIYAAVSLEPFLVSKNEQTKIVDYTIRAIPQKYVKENSKFNPVYNKPHIWFGGVVGY